MWPLIISSLAGIATANASRPRDPKQKTPIKNVIAIGLGGLTALGLYKLIEKELKQARNNKKNNKLFDEEKEGKDLSYKPSQYITWADKIEDSMTANFLDFTDEEAIYSVMRQLKTNNDWLELAKAYGLRKYYDPLSYDYILGKEVNLIKALQLELDTKEKNKINSILKSKNIRYRV